MNGPFGKLVTGGRCALERNLGLGPGIIFDVVPLIQYLRAQNVYTLNDSKTLVPRHRGRSSWRSAESLWLKGVVVEECNL